MWAILLAQGLCSVPSLFALETVLCHILPVAFLAFFHYSEPERWPGVSSHIPNTACLVWVVCAPRCLGYCVTCRLPSRSYGCLLVFARENLCVISGGESSTVGSSDQSERLVPSAFVILEDRSNTHWLMPCKGNTCYTCNWTCLA